MSDLAEILSRELIPWLQSTATVGVLAGATYGLMTWMRIEWQRLPLIEFDLDTDRTDSSHAFLRVTVMNRAPAPLVIESIKVMPGHKTKVHANVGDIPFEDEGKWPRGGLAPYVPGAGEFPQSSESFLVSGPREGEKVRLMVMMRARHQWIFSWKSGFTIKLPKKTTAL